MNKLLYLALTLTIVLMPGISEAAESFSKVIGWADVSADNGIAGTTVQTTTGGEGGTTVTVTSFTELENAIKSKSNYLPNPLIIRVKGTISGSGYMNVNKVKNMTIEGDGEDAKLKGFGFYVRESQNLIIRKISFEGWNADALVLDYQESHHIWIDHCNFSDIPMGSPNNEAVATSDANCDGAIDIKNAASYITISFCRFENHSKTVLIGHKKGNTIDIDHLKVTVHHNWFGYISQRGTRNRYGEMHLFNNYYKETGTMLFGPDKDVAYSHHGYAIASVLGAKTVVENNYFDNVVWPALVSRNSEKDPVWLQMYGSINNEPHWCPTSNEDPGFLSYRGENIQSPPAGTEITISAKEKWKILPLDTSNRIPGDYNPWSLYGYSQERINAVLHDAREVPEFVMKAINNGKVGVKSPMINSRMNISNIKNSMYYDLNGKQITGPKSKNGISKVYIQLIPGGAAKCKVQ